MAVIARSPKLTGSQSLQSSWYRYYPGFSENFAREVLRSVSLNSGEWVLDPWNGSGTTTSTAVSLGLNARGYDLNPVMVLVAKARCLEPTEFFSLRPLASEIVRRSKGARDPLPNDPLLTWLHSSSVSVIRAIEAAVQRLLIDDHEYATLQVRRGDGVSDIAAFFYVAMFRTIREVLKPFFTSNPTWIKRPRAGRFRLRPSSATIRDTFRSVLSEMLPGRLDDCGSGARGKKVIGVASSECLPLLDQSVSCILASPPYCTRIDYAVATSPELALCGYGLDTEFDELRRRLIGTSTVPSAAPEVPQNLGRTCGDFLEALSMHCSKASSTYYYKNHVQYFRSIGNSLSEICRVLKKDGRCILVVQDSYYKDLHNDLPTIVTEMATLRGLQVTGRTNFVLSRTMAGVNPGTQEYRTSFSAVESVLTFEARPRTSGTVPRS